MNNIKKIAVIFFLTFFTSGVFAEEAVKTPTNSVSETIVHLEKAIVEVSKSDFANALFELKVARQLSEQITGTDANIKNANASLIQGQIQARKGLVKEATDELTKALNLYKAL